MKEAIKKAIEVLNNGGIILYPTDTIWGIGCDATNQQAVEKIYTLKQREDSKSLVVLAADLDMIAKYVKAIPEMAITLVEITDKPLTIIYPDAITSSQGNGLAPNVVAEDNTVAIRVPMNDFCTQLIRTFRKPIVSTSANISGEKSPVHLKDVDQRISEAVDWTAVGSWDAGATGKASSIIKLGMNSEVKIIRE